jgi:elongation factor 1-gamma
LKQRFSSWHRGKDAIPVLSVAPDWESYNITPLDITTEEGKKFFNGAMYPR